MTITNLVTQSVNYDIESMVFVSPLPRYEFIPLYIYMVKIEDIFNASYVLLKQ